MRKFIDAGLKLLPGKMDTVEARAMLYAIGLQESEFEHRKQIIGYEDSGKAIIGKARSFWQFEPIGIKGVLYHQATKDYAEYVAKVLVLKNEAEIIEAVTYSDPLASAFARLNLWKFPDPLPDEGEVNKGWHQYVQVWMPGKPHRETWDEFFNKGWRTALEEKQNELL